MGVAVQQAEVRIAGTKFSHKGAVLITHWGLSGPAVIKLSAWAAVYLHQNNYTFTALVNWTGESELRGAGTPDETKTGKQQEDDHYFISVYSPQKTVGSALHSGRVLMKKKSGLRFRIRPLID
jgi:predicted flavoprotein YhiN